MWFSKCQNIHQSTTTPGMGKHNLHSFDLQNQQIEIRILNVNANIKVFEIGIYKPIFMVSYIESLFIL